MLTSIHELRFKYIRFWSVFHVEFALPGAATASQANADIATMLQPLLTLIRGESCRKVVAELEGYDSSGMGEVVCEE